MGACLQLLVIDNLFFDFFRHGPEFVLLVAELWFKTGFADSLLDSFAGKTVRRTRCTNYIFFDHDAAKVVSPGMQAELGYFLTNREPGGLDILDVGQHNSAQ